MYRMKAEYGEFVRIEFAIIHDKLTVSCYDLFSDGYRRP
jgi:hypothetical protein